MISEIFSWCMSISLLILAKLFRVPIVGTILEQITVHLVCLLRLLTGHVAAKGIPNCSRPVKMLKLFDREDDVQCGEVRETLCILDLDCEVYPCPGEAPFGLSGSYISKQNRFYQDAERYTSKSQSKGNDLSHDETPNTFKNENLKLPILVDVNTGSIIQGSSEKMIAYLWSHYGEKASPPLNYTIKRLIRSFTGLSLDFARYLRPLEQQGRRMSAVKQPPQKLILHSSENSPYCRIVRESLCSLEIPYILYNYPHGAGTNKRSELQTSLSEKLSRVRKAANLVQIPYLLDPNTKVDLLESSNIRAYLLNTYFKKVE